MLGFGPISSAPISANSSVATSFTLALGVGTYSITGAAANFAITAPFSVGTYTITGQAAAVLRGYVTRAAVGTYTITGSSAKLLETHILNGAAGSYSITGASAQFVLTAPLGIGSYVITGQAAAAIRGLLLNGSAGAYSLTGSAANLLRQFPLGAAAGSYGISGAPASFVAPARAPQDQTNGGAIVKPPRSKKFNQRAFLDALAANDRARLEPLQRKAEPEPPPQEDEPPSEPPFQLTAEAVALRNAEVQQQRLIDEELAADDTNLRLILLLAA